MLRFRRQAGPARRSRRSPANSRGGCYRPANFAVNHLLLEPTARTSWAANARRPVQSKTRSRGADEIALAAAAGTGTECGPSTPANRRPRRSVNAWGRPVLAENFIGSPQFFMLPLTPCYLRPFSVWGSLKQGEKEEVQ